MAGNYADAPGHRIQYDLDGTIVLRHDGSTVQATATEAEKAEMNDEDDVSVFSWQFSDRLVFIFPRLMNIDGIYVADQFGYAPVIFSSSDTTNGIDGTWFEEGLVGGHAGVNRQDVRNDIDAVTYLGVRAIRLNPNNNGTQLRAVHLYGTPAPGEDPRRLEVWDPVADQRMGPAGLDWADDPQGSSETAQFRIRNMDTTQTAYTIQLSIQALTDVGFGTAHTLSADNITYTPTLDIGNLDAGMVSPVLYVRREYTADQAVGPRTARMIVNPTGGYA